MPRRRPSSLLPLLLALVVAGAVDPAGAAERPPPSEAEVRTAVEKSLPYLERGGVEWMESHDCASCHQVPFLLWAHNAARSRGIEVDEAKLDGWTDWAAAKSLDLRDPSKPNKPGVTDGGGLDTLAQLLLGRAGGAGGDPMAKFVATTPALMAAWQQPDGRWKAAGQLGRQDRPAAETDVVATRWAALALGTIEEPDAPTAESLRRALAAVRDAPPGTSNESLITAYGVARRFGEAGGGHSEAADLLAALLRRQNPDGGWAWKAGGPSDAFATGQALYALGQARAPGGAPAIGPPIEQAVAGARRYLLDTQQADGSWPTTGEGISNAATPARRKKVEPIYRFWGTAWATIGLATSLPLPDRPSHARPASGPS